MKKNRARESKRLAIYASFYAKGERKEQKDLRIHADEIKRPSLRASQPRDGAPKLPLTQPARPRD